MNRTDVWSTPAQIVTDVANDNLISMQRTSGEPLSEIWNARACAPAQLASKHRPTLFTLWAKKAHARPSNCPGEGLHTRSSVKRSTDLFGSLILIIAFSPLLALIALLIQLDSPGPIIFKQKRIGRGGRPFTIYKFRTMRAGAEDEQEMLSPLNEAKGPLFKIRKDPRHTRLGRCVRRMSLDELPNFFNVVKGEMSLVGPRPPLPEEVEDYLDWHKQRLQVTPGITGLWQVSGRSELPFDEQCLLDLYYIEHWSTWLDGWIMLRTIPTVLSGRGAY